MRVFRKLTVAISGVLLCQGMAYASSIPNTSDPTTFLGPTARIGYTSTLTNTAAYSLAGEAGLKNFRVGATIGFKVMENQLFKISAEYLWQDITYAFFSGNTDQWVSQGALGAAYQYEFIDSGFRPQLELSAYVSHAPSKTLSTITGTVNNSPGLPIPFTNTRRIAGSNAAGISPGIAVSPWNGGRVELDLNYDNVRYDTKYTADDDATGFGGTVKFNQEVINNVNLGLMAAVRQPFNNYAANLDLNHMQFYGDWTLGLFGDYTAGKESLPNTWDVGLSANYFLDQRVMLAPKNYKGDLKGEMVAQPITDNLLAWTADPAVYMPQVLAITDQLVKKSCASGSAPAFTLQLIDQLTDPGTTDNIPTAPSFSGNNLTYSVSLPPGSISNTPPNLVTINSSTGVVTVHVDDSSDVFNDPVTVTATNDCGSASMTFRIFWNP